jgi:hypothetical protein
MGNDLRLKRDLASMGVFHESMSTYLLTTALVRGHGLSGFEGRFYSLFDSWKRTCGLPPACSNS